MVAPGTAKINVAVVLIMAAIMLYFLLMFLGLGLMSIALIFILLALIIYVVYLCSDKLIMAWMGASKNHVPASLAEPGQAIL